MRTRSTRWSTNDHNASGDDGKTKDQAGRGGVPVFCIDYTLDGKAYDQLMTGAQAISIFLALFTSLPVHISFIDWHPVWTLATIPSGHLGLFNACSYLEH